MIQFANTITRIIYKNTRVNVKIIGSNHSKESHFGYIYIYIEQRQVFELKWFDKYT